MWQLLYIYMYVMSDFFTKILSIFLYHTIHRQLQLYREKFGLTDLKFSYLHTKNLQFTVNKNSRTTDLQLYRDQTGLNWQKNAHCIQMLSSTYTLSENIVIEHSINFILAFSVWCHFMTQTSVWKSCILDFNLAISSSLDFSFLASWSRSFWFSAYHFNFRLRRSISSLYFSSNCWKEQNFYSCTFKAFSFVFYLESINISVYFPWPHQASNNKAWLNVPFTNNMFTVASKKQSLWI